jgi:ketosteroid isomerase-like protein
MGAERTVLEANEQWSKAAGAHDLKSVLSYYDDDAYVLPPNGPLATTAKAIHDEWAALLTPDLNLSWEETKVDSASSADMVYDLGTYTLSGKDSQGNPVSDKGKFVAIWKKQANGRWKVVMDTWNSDLPAAAPAPTPASAPEKAK